MDEITNTILGLIGSGFALVGGIALRMWIRGRLRRIRGLV